MRLSEEISRGIGGFL